MSRPSWSRAKRGKAVKRAQTARERPVVRLRTFRLRVQGQQQARRAAAAKMSKVAIAVDDAIARSDRSGKLEGNGSAQSAIGRGWHAEARTARRRRRPHHALSPLRIGGQRSAR